MSAQPFPRHPVLGAIEEVRARLSEVADANTVFLDAEAQRVALLGIEAAQAQLAELKLRVLACAAAVAQSDAARDVAAWQVAHNRRDIAAAKAEQRLAEALDRRYERVRSAMAEGAVHLDQALVIARALDDLPADVDAEVVADAEAVLVDLAARHTPRELRRLGQRVLHAVCPDLADQALAKQLEAEEAHARRKTTLTLQPCGDGTTRVTAVLPDPVAHRLKTYLDAFTSPRQGHKRGEGTYPQILGTAFCALLERIDPARLPQHGGRATTVIVTISLDQLRQDLGVGELVGAQALSATEVRRLACTAGIAPMVLGGQGEILDLGREQRLYQPPQVKAMVVRDRTCRAHGCDIPATWCEAHHRRSWATGGSTDLADGVMLCSHHHHRVHDPRYDSEQLPSGKVRITRRRN